MSFREIKLYISHALIIIADRYSGDLRQVDVFG
jgi:hypothetical protein